MNYNIQQDPVYEENEDLKKALKQINNQLDRTVQDYDTMKQMYESVKQLNDQLQQDNQELQKKLQMNITEKLEIEQHYEQAIKSFKNAIEQKQQELEDVQNKLQPGFDQDMLRIRLINELEMPHRLELDSKDMDISRQQNQIFELRRQLELFKAKYESLKGEAERDIHSLKETHKMEIRDLMLEIEVIHDESKQNKVDKENGKKLRIEIDELKTKLNLKEDLITQLRKDLDKEKEEKSNSIQELLREIEIVKSDKRKLLQDIDKLQAQKTTVEEELRSCINNVNKSPLKLMKDSEDNYQNLQQGQGTNMFDTDFQRFKEKEKLYKTLQMRIQDLQRQIEEERDNSKKTIKKLEDQQDIMKKQIQDKDQELRRQSEDSQNIIQEEKRRYNKLLNEYEMIEKDKNDVEDKFRDFKRKLYKQDSQDFQFNQNNEQQQQQQQLQMLNKQQYYNNNLINNDQDENFNDRENNENDNNINIDEIQEQQQINQKFKTNKQNATQQQKESYKTNNNNNNNNQSLQNNKDANKEHKYKEKLKLANKRIALLLQEKLIRDRQQQSLDNFDKNYQNNLGNTNKLLDIKLDLDAKRDRLNKISQNIEQVYERTQNPGYQNQQNIGYQQGPFIPRIITYSNNSITDQIPPTHYYQYNK